MESRGQYTYWKAGDSIRIKLRAICVLPVFMRVLSVLQTGDEKVVL